MSESKITKKELISFGLMSALTYMWFVRFIELIFEIQKDPSLKNIAMMIASITLVVGCLLINRKIYLKLS